METIGKNNLVDVVAEKAGLTKKVANIAVTAFLDGIVTNVADGNKVSIVGFGSFVKTHHEARKGRNPQTGDAIDIAAKDVPAFRAGSDFKSAVANG